MIKKKALFYNDLNGSFFSRTRQVAKVKNTSVLGYIMHKIANNFLTFLANISPIGGLRVFFHRKRGVKIGKSVTLSSKMMLERAFPEYIVIEDFVSFAPGVVVITHSLPHLHFKGVIMPHVSPVVFKKNSWIGAYSIILPGVTIGEGSIISAGSVVNTNVPDNCIVQGNPAQIIHRFTVKDKKKIIAEFN